MQPDWLDINVAEIPASRVKDITDGDISKKTIGREVSCQLEG